MVVFILDDFQVCDHTTTAAVYITDAPASTSTMRSVKIIGSRFATDAGKGIGYRAYAWPVCQASRICSSSAAGIRASPLASSRVSPIACAMRWITLAG